MRQGKGNIQRAERDDKRRQLDARHQQAVEEPKGATDEETERDGEEILEQARVRAESMVQRTEIVREAAHTAQKLVDDAKEEASRLRLEAEDYCDQKLGSFEIVLERTIKTVQAGREKLRVAPLPDGGRLGLGDESGTSTGSPPSEEVISSTSRSTVPFISPSSCRLRPVNITLSPIRRRPPRNARPSGFSASRRASFSASMPSYPR